MAFVASPVLGSRSFAPRRPSSAAASCENAAPVDALARRPGRPATRMLGGDPQFKIKNQAANQAWEVGYKAYLGKSGEKACRMAMEGFKKLGRGGVFVVDRPNVNVGVGSVGPDGVIDDAVTSMYVALAELEERSSNAQLDPIVSRMRLYDPSKQFVCVFEIQTAHGGVQGADIVTPKNMPAPS